MQRFNIPQFIDVEAKIIGPVTTRQFIISLVAAGLTFVEYKLFNFWAFAFFGLLTLGIGFALAFVRINGRPMHFFILNIIETFKRPNLRIWNKLLSSAEIKKELKSQKEKAPSEFVPTKKPLNISHLKQLSLVVDTGGVYQGEAEGLKLEGFETKEVRLEELEPLRLQAKINSSIKEMK